MTNPDRFRGFSVGIKSYGAPHNTLFILLFFSFYSDPITHNFKITSTCSYNSPPRYAQKYFFYLAGIAENDINMISVFRVASRSGITYVVAF